MSFEFIKSPSPYIVIGESSFYVHHECTTASSCSQTPNHDYHFLYQALVPGLHQRPLVHMPRPHRIIHHAKYSHAPEHRDTVIHGRGRRRRRGRPETEKQNHSHVYNAENINRDAKPAGHFPRPPRQLWGVAGDGRPGSVAGFANGAGATSPEEQN